jgi:integrase/recombinase XerD
MIEAETWLDRFRLYLESRNYSPQTVFNYQRATQRFLKYLAKQRLESVAGLTRSLLESYRMELFYARYRGKPLSAKTQAIQLTGIRRFVRFLVRHDYLLVDVSDGMEMPRVADSLPRQVLTEREAVRLVEAPDTSSLMGIRDRAILEILYGTGLRNGEMVNLSLDEIDWGFHCIRLRRGKGGKSRVVPLGEEAEIWLQEYLEKVRPAYLRDESCQRVFLTFRGTSFKTESMVDVVIRAARKIGLTKPTTPHVLRHSCATHMLKRGANLRYLQALLGHSSSQTTERYTRVEVSDLRQVVLRCHPREQP